MRRAACHPDLVAPELKLGSAKLDQLVELVKELVDNRHRALVFSQFTDYLALVRQRFEAELLLAHALPVALLPVAAWLSPALINIVTGSAVVEQVFGIPGMGRYFVQGALNRDYTLVLGTVLVVGAAIVAINALVDALRARMDPRLRDAG